MKKNLTRRQSDFLYILKRAAAWITEYPLSVHGCGRWTTDMLMYRLDEIISAGGYSTAEGNFLNQLVQNEHIMEILKKMGYDI